MKRFLLVALVCALTARAGRAQTVVSGNLKDVGVANASGSNTYVRFTLIDYGAQIPRIINLSGNVIFNPIKDFRPDANGNISGTIQGNDTITPPATKYQVCIYYQGAQFRCNTYIINGATFNLNAATALNTSVQVGANQLVVFSYPFTQATPASTWTIPHNFNDPNTYVQVFDASHGIIYPDHVSTLDPNNAVLTFITPTAGFAIAMHAGAINIATNQPNAVISNPIGSQVIGPQPLSIQGPATFLSPITAGKIDGGFHVDGQTYQTIAAANDAANAVGGGIVWIPDGTYVGPTAAHIYSGVYDVAEHPNRPNLCLDAVGVTCFNSTATTSNVTLTYSAPLALTDLTKFGFIGLTMDFGGTGNITFAGISSSYFDFTVRNVSSSGPCAVFTGSTNNNSAFNQFPYFGCSGGSEGLQFTKGPTNGRAFTDSDFGFVFIVGSGTPSTYTGLDFNSNCDTLRFSDVQLFAAQATVFGVLFNSASTTVDNDANGIVINFFAASGIFSSGGMGITMNPSSGNYIVTGAMPWGGGNQISIATGGPGNSPSFTWIKQSPTAGLQAQITSNILEALSAKGSENPTIRWTQNTTPIWDMYGASGGNLNLADKVNNRNVAIISQGAPASSFVVNGDGSISYVSVAFASLGTPSNNRIVYCPDCVIANPCAGGGTGAFAKRLNGVWVCN